MSTLTDAASNILTLQATCTSAERTPTWESLARYLVTTVQTAALALDADSTAWVIANRRFLKNVGVAPVVLTYNGQSFTFTNNKAYCAHPEEIDFFLNQAAFFGASFIEVVESVWFTDNDGVSFYFQ